MKGWKILGLLSIVASAASCGGGSAVLDQRVLSTYTGTWTGPWTSNTLGTGGTITLVIKSDGTFDAGKSTVTSGGSSTTTPVTGAMDTTGRFHGTMLGWGLDGQLTNTTGNLVGSFIISTNGTTYDGNWNLVIQATSSGG